MINNDSERKIKSKNNNNNCISKCFKKKTVNVHPFFLVSFNHKNQDAQDYCFVNPYKYTSELKKNKFILSNYCDTNYNSNFNNSYIYENNLEIPNIFLLNIIYDLYSITSVVDWVSKNKEKPYNTIKRLLNACWEVYIKEIDDIEDIFIEMYIFIINKHWIYSFYDKLYKYILYDKKKNIIIFENNNDSLSFKQKRIDFLKENYITFKNIRQYIFNYINNIKNFDSNDMLHSNLKKYILNELLKFF